jgi:hypothetical protein
MRDHPDNNLFSGYQLCVLYVIGSLLNTAPEGAQRLPGIGPLLGINGIKAGIIARLRDFVTVEP